MRGGESGGERGGDRYVVCVCVLMSGVSEVWRVYFCLVHSLSLLCTQFTYGGIELGVVWTACSYFVLLFLSQIS